VKIDVTGQPDRQPPAPKPFDRVITTPPVTRKFQVTVDPTKPVAIRPIVPGTRHEIPLRMRCALKMMQVDPDTDPKIHRQVPQGDFQIRRISPPACHT
jgi:hypothetical protein